MAISKLFVPAFTLTTAQNDKPSTLRQESKACSDILLIAAPCHRKWALFRSHAGAIDHIDTHWVRNAELQRQICKALTHRLYDAIVFCSEPLAPWMDLSQQEANDATSLITASGYTMATTHPDRKRDTVWLSEASLKA
ncbi:hypothetical protein ACGK9R_11525 [Halomonas sp. HNIBRBA4712]|uniref:hypothetical protein n=1 Tax=Halomonas sp. HNIBRBA4712 TaxID=3373087 RepID=UPI0037458D05